MYMSTEAFSSWYLQAVHRALDPPWVAEIQLVLQKGICAWLLLQQLIPRSGWILSV